MGRASNFSIVWAYKVWLVLFALVVAGVVYYVSDRSDPTYRAEALDQIVSGRQAEGDLLSEDELLSLSNLYLRLAGTDTVIRLAQREPSIAPKAAEFADSVGVESQERVGVLSFRADTADRNDAALFANAYATAFAEYIGQLEGDQRTGALDRIQERIDAITNEIERRAVAPDDPAVAGLTAELTALQERAAEETATPGDSVRVIEEAVAPQGPISPNPLRDALLAAIAALVLGTALAYLREAVVDRFATPEEAAAELSLPILAEIPREGWAGPTTESFRRLRTNLGMALDQSTSGENGGPSTTEDEEDAEGRGVVVTGAEPGSGKSYVTANLARALAAEGLSVAVIDGDLRRPTLHDYFDLSRNPGLGDALIARRNTPPTRSQAQVARRTSDPGDLTVVTAGTHIDDSVERFSSQRMRTVVTTLKKRNDVIVFDSPPTLAVVDAIVLARYTDGVVFVIDAKRTKRRDARRAVQTLRAMNITVLGLVMNRSTSPVADYYSYDAVPEGSGLTGPAWRRGSSSKVG